MNINIINKINNIHKNIHNNINKNIHKMMKRKTRELIPFNDAS